MKGIKSVLTEKPNSHSMLKVNEKNLYAFATSSSPKDCEGWLDTKEETSKNFQKRWFVLKGNLLFYFEKKDDKDPLGVIIVEGCTCELDESEHKNSFKIVFPGGRALILCADSQDSMEAWMKTLACAEYDYMQLMVSDLERQLSNIEAERKANNQPMDNQPKVPPRNNTRHNPFDKIPNMASTSLPVTGSLCGNTQNASGDASSSKSKFWQLHEEYGRMILADREQWMRKPEDVESLIQF